MTTDKTATPEAAPSLWDYVAKRTGKPMAGARPVAKRGFQKRSLLIGTQKMGAALHPEGPGEAAVALALDIDPRVQAFSPQPFTLRMDLAKTFSDRKAAVSALPRAMGAKAQAQAREAGLLEVIYTPDFKVRLHGNPVEVVIESKDQARLADAQCYTNRRRATLLDLGYQYLLLNSSVLAVPGFSTNARQVRDTLRDLKHHAAPESPERLSAALKRLPAAFTAGDLKANGVVDADLQFGVATGWIAYDLLGGHFTVDTSMWRAEGDLSHLQILPICA